MSLVYILLYCMGHGEDTSRRLARKQWCNPPSHTGYSSLSNATLSGQIFIFHLLDKLSTQNATVAHRSPFALGGLL